MRIINNPVLNVLFKEKAMLLILYLFKNNNELNYLTTLAREIDCTYSHLLKIVEVLVENNIIVEEKKGRIKSLYLTPKGLVLAKKLKEIVDLV